MRTLTLNERVTLLKSFVNGGRFLKQSPYWAPERMRDWQFARIQKLVTHAMKEIPFYRAHYGAASFELGDLKSWDDFHRLPLVTKDDVIQHFPEGMLKKGANLDDLIVSRSSGSSGKVLDVCYDSQAMITFMLAGLRLYRMGFRYGPLHRQLYIYTSPYPLSSVFGLFPMHFVSTLEEVDKIAAKIEAIRPELLVCYPSHLKQIAPLLSKRATSRLRCISVNSEMSTQAERDAISERWGCPVLDEYSSEELTRIAAQCTCGKYHVFEDINYMETLPPEPGSNLGVLVGTQLHNFAMPMIRYVQNDLGELQSSVCDCGWRFRQLINLQGRKNDSFLMPSGREISSGFLLDATYDILLEWREAVLDFCLIQTGGDQVKLQVVKGSGWSDRIAEEIKQRFNGYFKNEVRFWIEGVEICEKTRSGKRNPILRRIK
ncbi:hypothetical protein P3T73_10960 [Kiritimatiellota bacterium B12222]|nr:hypothetical protein P3T73_10960 [Kiritimatiellota bacterium B12222]